jgi:2-iminoacetate synthase ThiH
VFIHIASNEQNPAFSTGELIIIIEGGGKIPAQRDIVYNIIKIF